MSLRPRFPIGSNAFPSFNLTNNSSNINVATQASTDTFQGNVRMNFTDSHYTHSSNLNRFTVPPPNSLGTATNLNAANNVYNRAPLLKPPVNSPSISHPNLMSTTCPQNLTSFPPHLSNINPSFHPFQNKSCNTNMVPPVNSNSNTSNFNFEQRNISMQRFPPPLPNLPCNNLPPNNNYRTFQNNPNNNYPRFQNNSINNNPQFQNSLNNDNPINVPVSSPQFPMPMNMNNNANILPPSFPIGSVNNAIPQPAIYTTSLANIRPTMLNPPIFTSNLQNNFMQMPLQLPQNNALESQKSKTKLNPVFRSTKTKIAKFLAKFSVKQKENKNQVTIPEFRYVIKAIIRMIKLLNERKRKLSNLLDANENEWKLEVESAKKEQEELSTLCSFISAPDHLNNIISKLKLINKRRERKKKTKQNKFSEKMRCDQNRKKRDQEIDKWLDDIKEKNEKIKRELQLKKEADYILLEVRRKIYEAKKTIEKIKVFEKLRNARQANATRKGLHVLSIHNVKFEKKVSVLKETMIKQLADYEAEEKALKVMLETEQEGQREEEIQWKIKKMKTLQEKKQNHIKECLFGISDDPLPTDPIYLFYKYHVSATTSLENFVHIRQQWDIHISEDGEVIPQHWVVPAAPSNDSWKQCLVTSEK